MFLPGSALSARTDSITLSRMIVVLRQIGSSSVLDTTYFFGAFIMSPKKSPAGMGSNCLRVRHVGATPEQERVGVLHQCPECRADCVVPVGQRPATVLEAAIADLVLSAGRLEQAVEAHEFGHKQHAHAYLWVMELEWLNGDIRAFTHTSNEGGRNRHRFATFLR